MEKRRREAALLLNPIVYSVHLSNLTLMEGAAPFKQIINDAVAILFNLLGHISDLSCVLNTVHCTMYTVLYNTVQLLFILSLRNFPL